MVDHDAIAASYDSLAIAYAEQLVDELDRKPFDRWILDRLAGLADGGPIADAGCGPGHVAFHLAQAGAEVTGFDLSPAMVREACKRFPGLAVEVADLHHLPVPSGGEGWAGIAAWYSLVHLPGDELPLAVSSLVAVLRPGGWLGVAVHAGGEVRQVTELWDVPVELDFVFHEPADVIDAFEDAGLEDVEWYLRAPIPGAEADTERLYVLGRRPLA
ncbi:MAG: class I SAM-dependent methyltransferase [Acidimicrobiales bacterium]